MFHVHFKLKGVQVVMSIGDYRSAARSRIRGDCTGQHSGQIKRNGCKLWIAHGLPFPTFPLDFERERKTLDVPS